MHRSWRSGGMADAGDLKSPVHNGRAGSSPAFAIQTRITGIVKYGAFDSCLTYFLTALSPLFTFLSLESRESKNFLLKHPVFASGVSLEKISNSIFLAIKLRLFRWDGRRFGLSQRERNDVSSNASSSQVQISTAANFRSVFIALATHLCHLYVS